MTPSDGSDLLYSPSLLKLRLAELGVELKKGLGQNLLVDRNIVEKILDRAEVSPGDLILEIGSGAGNLTRGLLSRGARVVSVELDRAFRPFYEEFFKDENVEFFFEDFMKFDFESVLLERLGSGIPRVIANIPYSITSPVITRILESSILWKDIYLMMAEDVARRVSASPGTRDFGVLSILVRFYSDSTILFRIKPGSFFPSPEISSCFVRFKPHERYRYLVNGKQFISFVRACFSTRRKKLSNSLAMSGILELEKTRALVAEAGIDADARPEALDVGSFIELYRRYLEMTGGDREREGAVR